MEERRRSPRHNVREDVLRLPTSTTVRVVDISTAGVLLQSPHMLNPGARAHLRFTLAGAPFAADVVVQRVAPSPRTGMGYRIGATFAGMSHEHQQLIERFMNND